MPSVLDRLYVYIRLTGTYEHEYVIRHYCRVNTVDVHVVVLPAVMREHERLAALDRMVGHWKTPSRSRRTSRTSRTSRNKPSSTPTPTDPNTLDALRQRAHASYIDVYTPEELDHMLYRAQHPKPPAYIESRPPKPLHHPVARPTAPTTFRTDRRQPEATIDTLQAFGLTNVKVRELHPSHVLHLDDGQDAQPITYSLFGSLFGFPWLTRNPRAPPGPLAVNAPSRQHPEAIRQSVTRTKVQLETYLNDPQKLAVVGVLPKSHQKVLRMGSSGRPERFDRVVAVALFTFVPNSSTRPTYVRLDGVLVDYAYDETLQPLVSRRNENYGIYANFVRAAMRYALHVGDDHDVVYDVVDDVWHQLLRYMNRHTTTRAYRFETLLRKCAFVPMSRLVEPPNAIVQSAPSSSASSSSSSSSSSRSSPPGRTWSQWFRDWIRRRTATSTSTTGPRPPLVYSALHVHCQPGRWKECLARVQALHQDKPFSEQLRIASRYYNPNGQPSPRPVRKHTRSKRQVSLKRGAEVLQSYYAQKYLPGGTLPTVSSPTPPTPTTSSPTTSSPTTSSPSPSPSRSPAHRYCTAIRNHLQRTSKARRPVLTLAEGNTWRFRPREGVPITPESKGPPDRYYLEGLDMTTDIGRALFVYPMGKRGTPRELVRPVGTVENTVEDPVENTVKNTIENTSDDTQSP